MACDSGCPGFNEPEYEMVEYIPECETCPAGVYEYEITFYLRYAQVIETWWKTDGECWAFDATGMGDAGITQGTVFGGCSGSRLAPVTIRWQSDMVLESEQHLAEQQLQEALCSWNTVPSGYGVNTRPGVEALFPGVDFLGVGSGEGYAPLPSGPPEPPSGGAWTASLNVDSCAMCEGQSTGEGNPFYTLTVTQDCVICEPPPNGCDDGFVWNQEDCQCEPEETPCQEPEGGCDDGLVWNQENCACEQPVCPPGSSFNPETGFCEDDEGNQYPPSNGGPNPGGPNPPAPPPPPGGPPPPPGPGPGEGGGPGEGPGEGPSGPGGCDPPLECDPDEYPDYDLCECLPLPSNCELTTEDCEEQNKVLVVNWDGTCQCENPPTPPGGPTNPGECPDPGTCDEGEDWNEETCACEARTPTECADGEVWDEDQGACVREPRSGNSIGGACERSSTHCAQFDAMQYGNFTFGYNVDGDNVSFTFWVLEPYHGGQGDPKYVWLLQQVVIPKTLAASLCCWQQTWGTTLPENAIDWETVSDWSLNGNADLKKLAHVITQTSNIDFAAVDFPTIYDLDEEWNPTVPEFGCGLFLFPGPGCSDDQTGNLTDEQVDDILAGVTDQLDESTDQVYENMHEGLLQGTESAIARMDGAITHFQESLGLSFLTPLNGFLDQVSNSAAVAFETARAPESMWIMTVAEGTVMEMTVDWREYFPGASKQSLLPEGHWLLSWCRRLIWWLACLFVFLCVARMFVPSHIVPTVNG